MAKGTTVRAVCQRHSSCRVPPSPSRRHTDGSASSAPDWQAANALPGHFGHVGRSGRAQEHEDDDREQPATDPRMSPYSTTPWPRSWSARVNSPTSRPRPRRQPAGGRSVAGARAGGRQLDAERPDAVTEQLDPVPPASSTPEVG